MELKPLGVEVEALDDKAMAKLGMNALLAVGQGSERDSRLVVMRWRGVPGRKAKPIVFVGKGVCFDSGGISIKPAAGMEDMKGDMGGAACVVGLMHALATRKAKVDAVGVVGLVENMPGGGAYRPSDILKSMSGQTIEVINTDAEGRLVLADALTYAREKFKPRFMVDLATLTGAILVALGQEHAGLFSNDDELAARLSAAGAATGETVWRMPLGSAYDKMIDSRFADMKNTGGRNGGAITAAQFLKRFVGDTPWAHLDIAGTGMSSPANDINQSWGSGWGVRLLDRLVADYYESKWTGSGASNMRREFALALVALCVSIAFAPAEAADIGCDGFIEKLRARELASSRVDFGHALVVTRARSDTDVFDISASSGIDGDMSCRKGRLIRFEARMSEPASAKAAGDFESFQASALKAAFGWDVAKSRSTAHELAIEAREYLAASRQRGDIYISGKTEAHEPGGVGLGLIVTDTDSAFIIVGAEE